MWSLSGLLWRVLQQPLAPLDEVLRSFASRQGAHALWVLLDPLQGSQAVRQGLRLCRALWSGEPVDWDGRWKVEKGVLGPTPVQKNGPPIWGGGSVTGALKRAAKNYDGWFPTGPADSAIWGEQWRETRGYVKDAGRDVDAFTGAVYLTLALDDDTEKANAKVNKFLEDYYMQPAEHLRKRQACYGGPPEGAAQWLKGYVDQGASHLMLRFAGDHDRHLEAFTKVRASLGW